MKHKPKKSFGQNFLTSAAARAAIIKASQLRAGEKVLEIGPGQGFLTEGLLESGAQVLALEMDRDLLPILADKFRDEIATGQLEIRNIDALQYTSPDNNYKLIANIPYYITGAILESYLSAKHKPQLMTVLVQKEVAERVIARDGKESILSISVKIYGQPKMIQKVLAGSFYPRPKVDSAILCVENINNDFFSTFNNAQLAEKAFFLMLRASFIYKRKFLLNNIANILEDKDLLHNIFARVGLNERERAENVTIEQWKQLFSLIYPHL